MFSEQGVNAKIATIADRAGVGSATVYRSYPSKSDLLAEVALRWLTDWTQVLEVRVGSGQPAEVFSELMLEVFERLRTDRLVADLLRASRINDEVTDARTRMETLFTHALRRAIEAGAVKDDVTYAELSVLVLGTAGRLSEIGEVDPGVWRRIAALVIAGVSAT